jgi:Zn-dependent protease with chaperone function
LHVWSIDELRAVLAHELVHLRFEDATFARDVLEMTRGLRSRLAESIDRPGGRWRRRWALVCVSLVEWMARPVSRWMEFRADEVSARACGSLALQSALEKLAMVQPIFREILTQSSTLATANVYRLFAKAWKRLAQGDYESLRQRLLKPSAEESGLHPPVSQRIDRLRHLPQQKPREFFPALHLLDDPKQLERVLHNRLFAFESPIARKSPHSPREGRRDDR